MPGQVGRVMSYRAVNFIVTVCPPSLTAYRQHQNFITAYRLPRIRLTVFVTAYRLPRIPLIFLPKKRPLRELAQGRGAFFAGKKAPAGACLGKGSFFAEKKTPAGACLWQGSVFLPTKKAPACLGKESFFARKKTLRELAQGRETYKGPIYGPTGPPYA